MAVVELRENALVWQIEQLAKQIAQPVGKALATAVETYLDQLEVVDATIDSGADATIVPVRLLRHIGARRTFETGLRSQWGET